MSASTQPKDFTEDQYRNLLVATLRQYRPSGFSNLEEVTNDFRVFWRHDVDCSLNRAWSLAQMEAAVGMRATYFVDLHSQFYNVHEGSQVCLLKRILDCGHDLGIHFDAHFHGAMDEQDLVSHLSRARDQLEYLTGATVTAFTFHNPSEMHLVFDEPAYAGLFNCYSPIIRGEVDYCSDSNGYWRFQDLASVVRETPTRDLQVLTHPEWWQPTEMLPRQRIQRSVLGRAFANLRSYDTLVEAHGRVNIGVDFRRLLSTVHILTAQEAEWVDLLLSSGQVDIALGFLRRRLDNPLSADGADKLLMQTLQELVGRFPRIAATP